MPEQPNTITIQLNGEPCTLQAGSTLQELLLNSGTDGKTIATLVNDHIVRPENRPEYRLEAGDRVEMLIFAGGG
ncbi:MAG: sulfur carrier protein ThiS [Chlorobium sp.]|jgi:sulfur carrier protein|uniref:sulfur carrier protein ThiS n=1 Tax=Chlorobium sp. TaxID=1095 RepID=UPI001D633E38|nr:sulfur carrier protein ThiS [Chlorobium sp.]MBN1278890.1 sulfur carrier protein ThiS [Chlorobiaceae bacterium]MCF8216735.1 sulfur carrier protein ThiS [Chlorobium sp.]MCF8271590.1 sulfur carrier protein ThiS [Chlorobium sp.]MCF8287975.1 sulfur carrier protein ThiS [Chlorobium sp.]MCF8291507.1 sulfur carrier protein ThiS [Chlorobium sp.]